MKSITLIFFFCSGALITAFAQKHTRGYIAVGIGSAYIVNNPLLPDDPKLGLNLNFVNAGYSVYKGIGINASWSGVGHQTEQDNSFGYGSVMIGPMYTISFSANLKLDIKARIGQFYQRYERRWTNSGNGDPLLTPVKSVSESSSFSWSSGVMLRQHFATRWLCAVSLDAHNGNTGPFFDNYLPVTFTAGIGYGFGVARQ